MPQDSLPSSSFSASTALVAADTIAAQIEQQHAEQQRRRQAHMRVIGRIIRYPWTKDGWSVSAWAILGGGAGCLAGSHFGFMLLSIASYGALTVALTPWAVKLLDYTCDKAEESWHKVTSAYDKALHEELGGDEEEPAPDEAIEPDEL